MKDRNFINEQIRAIKVRLIDSDGQNLGVVDKFEALKKAREKTLDLVEVSKGEIPVCKIIDYNKFVYDKKSKFKKAKVKKVDVKELVIKTNIGEGDLNTKIKRAKEFLLNGNMVKFSVKFEGRLHAFPELGVNKLKIVESELLEIAKIEKSALERSNSMYMVFMPK